GLLNEKVYALLEDSSGRVWAGTRGGGLFVYENETFKYVKDRKGDIGRFVGGLFLNEDGKILVGTTDGIIEFLPERPNVFRRMPVDKGTAVNAVSAIFRDKKSRLGQEEAEVLSIFTLKKGGVSSGNSVMIPILSLLLPKTQRETFGSQLRKGSGGSMKMMNFMK
ncbi:hypothetical protein IKP13_00830, partial [bacterium]|nr:hypothetical protein [bacterium]